MSQVTTAYDALLELAQSGRPFVDGEVFYPIPTDDNDPRRSLVVGHGYDFERTVTVTDQSTDNPVPGTARLRILRLTKDKRVKLFLRARLEWITSDGAEHASYASYKLSAEAAARLANDQPANDDLSEFDDLDPNAELSPELAGRAMTVLFASIGQAEAYGAHWKQTFPGSDWSDEDDLALMETGPAVVDAAAEYHSQAVTAAVEANPQLLCMLSDSELGAVGPDELTQLLDWVSAQPELTADHA